MTGSSNRRRVWRDLSLQASGSYFAQGLQVVRGAILASLLGPAGMGTVASVNLVLAYSQYADLGVGLGASREIPVAQGQGSSDGVASYRRHAYVARLASSLVVAAGLATYAMVAGDSLSDDFRFGILTAAVVVVLQAVQTLQLTIFQSSRQFGRASGSTVALWGASLAFGVSGALVAGVKGVFVSQVAALVLAVAVGLGLGGGFTWGRVTRRQFAVLLRVGAPMMVLWFMLYSLVNVDQIMIVSLLDTNDLGLYTIVLYGGTALYLLPTAVAAVVGPRLLEAYGRSSEVAAIRGLTWEPVAWLSLAMPPLIMAVWFVGPALIELLLPDYVTSIGPLRVYAVAMFFLAVNLGVSTTLLALRRHQRNIPVIAACIALNVVADLVLIEVFGLGLVGISLGSLITYAAYWMTHTLMVRHLMGERFGAAIAGNLRSAWPGAVLVALVAVCWAAGTLDRSIPLVDLVLFIAVVALTAVRWRRGEYRSWWNARST